MDTQKTEQPTIVSIGLNESGKMVFRVRFADKSIRDYATDTVSFAQMAAKGIRVYNAGRS